MHPGTDSSTTNQHIVPYLKPKIFQAILSPQKMVETFEHGDVTKNNWRIVVHLVDL